MAATGCTASPTRISLCQAATAAGPVDRSEWSWANPPVDLVGDLAAKGSYCFCLGVAHGQATSNVNGGGPSESHQRDCDPLKTVAADQLRVYRPEPPRRIR